MLDAPPKQTQELLVASVRVIIAAVQPRASMILTVAALALTASVAAAPQKVRVDFFGEAL